MAETIEFPVTLTHFRLPEALEQRLQNLVSRRDGGEELTIAEGLEAEGLVQLAEFLSILKDAKNTLKVKGIVRGQMVELIQPISTEDGTEVLIEIPYHVIKSSQAYLSNEEKLIRLNRLFGVWKDQSELMDFFAEIDRERHGYRGRAIEPLES